MLASIGMDDFYWLKLVYMESLLCLRDSHEWKDLATAELWSVCQWAIYILPYEEQLGDCEARRLLLYSLG